MSTESPPSTTPQQSNKYRWTTHQVPRPLASSSSEQDTIVHNEDELTSSPPAIPPESYVIRNLKQGTTGATKTWPACGVLLDYLVCRGGLRELEDKLPARAIGSDDASIDVLDMTLPPNKFYGSATHPGIINNDGTKAESGYNIVELGAGTGCLGVGLSMALNHRDEDQSTAKILCTDLDKGTIKNMRFNISEQPRASNVNKNVRVEPLGWADNIGGEKFSKAVERQFVGRGADDLQEEEEPLRLVTHLIGSDIHFGSHTLEPLSSVISAFKLRNPDIIVVVMIKERSPESFADVAELASIIEEKVKRGLELDEHVKMRSELDDFSVSVRDVLHEEVMNMKLVEC